MIKHNFSAGQDSKWVRPAVAAGIGIPAGYAAYQYGGNLGTYLGDKVNVPQTVSITPNIGSTPSSDLVKPVNIVKTSETVRTSFPIKTSVPVSAPDSIGDIRVHVPGHDNPIILHSVPPGENMLDTPVQIGSDPDNPVNLIGVSVIPVKPNSDDIGNLIGNIVKYGKDAYYSRRPSRFVALHTNFAKKKSEAANPGGVVINLPNGKKYTEDDIRYLNNKRVFGTDSWGLIPSALVGVPVMEGSASLMAGNPMGHKERGLRTAANLTAGFGFPFIYPVGANIVDYNAYLDENTRRKSIGKDLPLPDKDDLDYMNAKLRYENSAVGRHPILTGLTRLTSPIAIDAWRGVQNRGRAWKYGLGSPIAGGALGAAAGAALGSVLGDPEAGAITGGILGIPLGNITGGALYNTRGKKHYEAEKAKRKAEGRMY